MTLLQDRNVCVIIIMTLKANIKSRVVVVVVVINIIIIIIIIIIIFKAHQHKATVMEIKLSKNNNHNRVSHGVQRSQEGDHIPPLKSNRQALEQEHRLSCVIVTVIPVCCLRVCLSVCCLSNPKTTDIRNWCNWYEYVLWQTQQVTGF